MAEMKAGSTCPPVQLTPLSHNHGPYHMSCNVFINHSYKTAPVVIVFKDGKVLMVTFNSCDDQGHLVVLLC